MNIASPWTITWDVAGTPLVLVTAGDELAELIRWPAKQKLEEREVIEGLFIDYLPRGQKSGELAFTVFKNHATLADAWAWVGAALAAVPWSSRKSVDLAMAGGATLRMALCAFESAEPRVEPTATPRSAMKYVLKGRPPVTV